MGTKRRFRLNKSIITIVILFFIISGMVLFAGSRYINSRLLQSNENMAIDLALLVKNNFQISDEEVDYMKKLTFNEMEVDPINLRLMNIGNDVKLNCNVTNVYIIAPLTKDEIKYSTDKETSEFFGYEIGTELDGIWLLNGIMNDKGQFVAKQRDDIYRYTALTDTQVKGMEMQTPFGEYSKDAWGSFITGYVPIYTDTGNFVGLLGIDMNPDKYQADAKNMVLFLVILQMIISSSLIILFIYFYNKYMKVKEGQLYFEFYSRMSHDLRTPMNEILGLASLSKDEKDISILHDNFNMVEDSGQYMLSLINDTLDVQKLDAGKLKLDPKIKSCNTIQHSIVSTIKTNAAKKNIDVEVINIGIDEKIVAYVDEIRLKQIFLNLGSNAVKFTPEGGNIRIVAECLNKEGMIHHDKFQIIDNGIGMSEDFINKRMFKPFSQEQDSVTTQYGGSGLGLCIVKNLVQLMGGKLEVESTLGKGTTFTIYLDIEEVDAKIVETEIKKIDDKKNLSLDSLKGKSILLCEDHPVNAEIACRLLNKYGCSVVHEKNGQEGLKRFISSKPGDFDVILMDIRMPLMDGLTTTKEIRKLNRADAKTIPIIAMTANAYDEDKKECKNAGMNGHIPKPINPAEMYKIIVENLNTK